MIFYGKSFLHLMAALIAMTFVILSALVTLEAGRVLPITYAEVPAFVLGVYWFLKSREE